MQKRKFIRRPESFLEDKLIPCVLVAAKFELGAEGQKRVRLDLEAAASEARAGCPTFMREELAAMEPHYATRVDFGIELAGRLVEFYLREGKKPAAVIDNTSIVRIRFERKDPESEARLCFSMTESAAAIGHWVVDHYGDAMFIQTIRAQLEIPERA